MVTRLRKPHTGEPAVTAVISARTAAVGLFVIGQTGEGVSVPQTFRLGSSSAVARVKRRARLVETERF